MRYEVITDDKNIKTLIKAQLTYLLRQNQRFLIIFRGKVFYNIFLHYGSPLKSVLYKLLNYLPA